MQLEKRKITQKNSRNLLIRLSPQNVLFPLPQPKQKLITPKLQTLIKSQNILTTILLKLAV